MNFHRFLRTQYPQDAGKRTSEQFGVPQPTLTGWIREFDPQNYHPHPIKPHQKQALKFYYQQLEQPDVDVQNALGQTCAEFPVCKQTLKAWIQKYPDVTFTPPSTPSEQESETSNDENVQSDDLPQSPQSPQTPTQALLDFDPSPLILPMENKNYCLFPELVEQLLVPIARSSSPGSPFQLIRE